MLLYATTSDPNLKGKKKEILCLLTKKHVGSTNCKVTFPIPPQIPLFHQVATAGRNISSSSHQQHSQASAALAPLLNTVLYSATVLQWRTLLYHNVSYFKSTNFKPYYGPKLT